MVQGKGTRARWIGIGRIMQKQGRSRISKNSKGGGGSGEGMGTTRGKKEQGARRNKGQEGWFDGGMVYLG
jgi:hypothetical protein